MIQVQYAKRFHEFIRKAFQAAFWQLRSFSSHVFSRGLQRYLVSGGLTDLQHWMDVNAKWRLVSAWKWYASTTRCSEHQQLYFDFASPCLILDSSTQTRGCWQDRGHLSDHGDKVWAISWCWPDTTKQLRAGSVAATDVECLEITKSESPSSSKKMI